MNKQEFLAQLRKQLSGLPLKDAEDRITFYSEMIDDRMEEGLSEPEAVSAIPCPATPSAFSWARWSTIPRPACAHSPPLCSRRCFRSRKIATNMK